MGKLKKFMGKEFMGILRTTFVIDKELRLVAIMDKFKTGNHHNELLNCLDKTFSIDGYTTKNIGTGNDYVHTAALQPNGRLVVFGSSFNKASVILQ